MKKFTPFICCGIGSKRITFEQAATLFTPEEIKAGQKRGAVKSFGPWSIPVTFKALAVSRDFNKVLNPENRVEVFGPRTMTSVRQSGYCLEGRVSVAGKSRRAFTSSMLFELPDGVLVDCAIIHLCNS